jgi:hypothetical protein
MTPKEHKRTSFALLIIMVILAPGILLMGCEGFQGANAYKAGYATVIILVLILVFGLNWLWRNRNNI